MPEQQNKYLNFNKIKSSKIKKILKITTYFTIALGVPFIIIGFYSFFYSSTDDFNDESNEKLKKNISVIEYDLSHTDNISEDLFRDICGNLKYSIKKTELSYFYFKIANDKICYEPKNILYQEIINIHKDFIKDNSITFIPKSKNPIFKDFITNVYSNFSTAYILQMGSIETEFSKNKFSLKFKKSAVTDFSRNIGLIFWMIFLVILLLYYLITSESLAKIQAKNQIDIGFYKKINLFFKKIGLEIDSEVSDYNSAIIDFVEKQKKAIEILRTNLPEYFKKLYLLGKIKIPYRFKGVMAAADINNFSRIKYDKNAEQLYNTITEFLEKKLYDLSVRFQAGECRFDGDMVLAVFQGEKCHQRAYLFTRALINEFNKIDFIYNEQPIKLFFKSGLKEVDLVYKKRIFGGQEISGLNFIHVMDLLKSFTNDEKFESRIAIDSNEVHKYSELFSDEHIVLKTENITKVNNSYNIDYIINNKIELLEYYISNDEISFILNKIQKTEDILEASQLIKMLHTVHLVFSSDELFDNLKSTLLVLKEKNDSNSKWLELYTELLSTVSNLIDRDTFVKLNGIDFLFSHYYQSDINLRIKSTVAEVLNNLGFPNVVIDRISKEDSKSNILNYRLQGEILRAESMIGLSNKVLDKLNNMLKDSKTQANGIYYTYKIFSYFKEQDPAALLLFDNYNSCIKTLSKIDFSIYDSRISQFGEEICLIHNELNK